MTLITSEQLNQLFYYAVLLYIGKTINTEDYNFYLEQDLNGDVFISYWGLEDTQPTREDLLTLQYEDVLALSQRPNIYDIIGSKIPILTTSQRTYVKDNFTGYGVAPGVFIYNSTDNTLEVLNEALEWVAVITNSSL